MNESVIATVDSEVTVEKTEATLTETKSAQEIALEDAMHYLGGFILPVKEDTLREVKDEETGEVKVELDPEFALRYKAFLKRRDQMDEELAKFKDYAYGFLSERDYKEPVSSEGVNILLQSPYTRRNVKSTELKEVLPTIYDMFTKEVNVKGSVQMKVVEETYNPWDFLKK